MKERPILFNREAVQAILGGRKTQMRRVVKGFTNIERYHHQGEWRISFMCKELVGWACPEAEFVNKCPYGVPGDRLWVREKWRPVWHPELYCSVQYAADSSYQKPEFFDTDRGHRFADLCDSSGDNAESWHSSLHMWREMSRLTLEVVGVRVERLQSISEEDAKAEGVERHTLDGVVYYGPDGKGDACPVRAFSALWDSINGEGSWASNPWVWVVEFRRVGGGA